MSETTRGPGFTLEWAGAQRLVLAGDLTPRADLGRLEGRAHVSALGPLAGLRGEVTVIDGVPLVSTVVSGAVMVERSFAHRACFLVHADVSRWRWHAGQETLAAWTDLGPRVRRAAADAGLDPAGPWPFRITGRAVSGTLHVLDKRDERPHSPERHEEAKIRFPLAADDVEVVGFYSERHPGVFVPRDSPLHAHLAARDRTLAGHLDALQLAAGWTLGLPAPGGEDRP